MISCQAALQSRVFCRFFAACIIRNKICHPIPGERHHTKLPEWFGNIRPFTRIAEAEKRHIALLKPMLAKYSVPVPPDRSAQYITVPESLQAALKAGAAGERENMRMYEVFLKQQLPEDVRLVFTLLRNAAARHLQAFERNLPRLGA